MTCWEEGSQLSALVVAEVRICLGSLCGEKFVVGRNTSQGYGREIRDHKPKPGSVDPKCGSEEVNSKPEHSSEVVREDN